MFGKLRAAGLALAFLGVVGVGAARAQAPEAEALGVEIAHVIFEAVDFDQVILKEVREGALTSEGIESRPEWEGYLRDAMAEEVAHDLPAIERMFGRTLARALTVDELKAGVTIMKDPMFQAAMAAGAQDKEAPAGQPSREARRAMGTPAGQRFLTKLDGIDKMFETLEGDFLAEIMPGTLRRLADKIDAGELRRASATRP